MTRATITRHVSPDHSWMLAVRAAHPAVRPVVDTYVGYEERCRRAVRRIEVPHPNVTVIINLGSRLTIQAPALDREPRTVASFSAGLYDTAVVTDSVDGAAGIELNLSPLATWRLLGVRMSLLQNRVFSLDDVMGPAGRVLEERLRNTAEWDARFDLLDATLAAHTARREPPREIVWAWQRLNAPVTRNTIAALTTELGWSRRRLAEAFREYIGMTPKSVTRVIRFDRAIRALRAGRVRSWSELAYSCGYADQAHLTREFREFAGLTPTQCAGHLSPMGVGAP